MPTLQGSGAISLNDIRNVFGGANPVSLNQFYRGGGLVPTTGTTTVQEGPFWSLSSTPYYGFVVGINNSVYNAWWNQTLYMPGYGATSFVIGIYTYYRGNFRRNFSDEYGSTYNEYEIYRTTSSTVSINPNVPGSGTFSFSQLYGAKTA